jgi:hypothetical protein
MVDEKPPEELPGKPTPEEIAAADEPIEGADDLPDDVKDGDVSEGDAESDGSTRL